MKYLVLALVLVAVALAFVFLSGNPPDTAVEPSGVAAAERDDSARALSDADAAKTVAGEAAHGVREESRTPAAQPHNGGIHGRCIAAETRKALAGCVIQLRGWVRNDAALAKYGKGDWKNPPKVTTRADGLFAFRFDPHPAYQYLLDCRSAGRGVMRGRWLEIAPGKDLDLGDVPMELGATVTGHAVAENGVAVAKVRFRLQQDGLELRKTSKLHPKSFAYVFGRDDGSLRGDEPLLPGTWTIHMEGDTELVRPKTVEVASGQRVVPLELVVKRPADQPSLSGTVVDEAGLPVAGVTLTAAPAGTGVPLSRNRGWSGKDGTFTIRRREGGDEPVRIGLNVASHGYELVTKDATYRWGKRGIRIVVKRPAGVRLTVVEAGTGTPVEDYFVRCYPVGRSTMSSSDRRPRATGKHEDGFTRLTGIAHGKNSIQVYPRDAGLVPSPPKEFDVGDAGAALRIELQRRQPLTVRVVLTDGTPVTGSKVELIRKEGKGELEMSSVSGTPAEAYDRFWSSGAMAIVLDSAETGADGEAILRGPVSSGGLAVKALGPGHVPTLTKNVSLGPAVKTLVVRVSRGAVLFGHLEPASVVARMGPDERTRQMAERMGSGKQKYLATYRPSLRLQQPATHRAMPAGFNSGYPIADDGSFETGAIPAGDWEVKLHYFQATSSGGSWADEPLQTVRGLTDGEKREVKLDVSALIPGELIGRCLVNGKPWANGEVRLSGQRPDDRGGNRSAIATARTDAEGRFHVSLVAAIYVAHLPLAEKGWQKTWIPCTDRVPVQSGQESHHVFRFVRAKVVVRILLADGKTPVADREFQFSAPDYWSMAAARTDEHGTLVLDPAPPGPIRLTTWPRDLATQEARMKAMKDNPARLQNAQIELGPIEVPAGRNEASFELRMPQGIK